jgi:hypothetical protein
LLIELLRSRLVAFGGAFRACVTASLAKIGFDGSSVAVVDLAAANDAPPVHVVRLPKLVSATVAIARALSSHRSTATRSGRSRSSRA